MKQKYISYLNQFKGFFVSGLSPAKLSLTIAMGIITGLFPVIGVTTVLCIFIGIIFKLNIILLQLTNWLLAPLQIVLIVPFYKLGAFIFGSNHYNENILNNILNLDFNKSISTIISAELTAIGGWAFVSLPMFIISYFVIDLIAKRKSF